MTRLHLLVLASVALLACPGPVEEDDVQSFGVLSVAGLWTNPSEVSAVPPGAMREADNLVFQRPGIAETRKGFEATTGAYPTASTPRSITTYQGYIIAWFANDVLARYQLPGGPWTAYSGTYSAPYSQGRVHWMEVNGVLYFTAAAGVYRLDSPTGTPALAGVPAATVTTASLTGASGFLADGYGVAYRTLWGRYDGNDILLRGEPTSRVVVVNAAGASRNVTLRNYIPGGVDANHFLQIHRTGQVLASIDPGDEMAQVYEVFPTALDITNGYIDVIDQTPDSLRGPEIYTLASLPNAQPPVASDIVEFHGHAVAVRAVRPHAMTVTLLGVAASSSAPGLFGKEGLVIDGVTYSGGASEIIGGIQFKLETTLTPAQNVAETAKSLARVVSLNTGGAIDADYIGDDSGIVGQVLLRRRNAGAAQFTVRSSGPSGTFVPAMRSASGGSLTRAANVVTFNAPPFIRHGLSVGQQVVLVASDDTINFPLGTKTVTSITNAWDFTYAETGADGTTPTGIIETLYDEGMSTQLGDTQTAIAYSKQDEPDSMPVANTINIGAPGVAVLRAIKVGGSLYVLKEGDGGLWRLSGQDPDQWVVQPWDETVRFVAREAVAVGGGAAFALTNDGVVRWTENGKPEAVSLAINNVLRDLVQQAPDAVAATAWMSTNDARQELYLGLPSNNASTYATQLYVYNWLTNAWGRWTVASYTGHVSPYDGRLYLSPPTDDQLWRQRGAASTADYQDAAGEAIAVRATFVPQNGGSPELEKQWTEVELYFNGSAPSAVTARFATEQAPTVVTVPCDTPDDGDAPGILRCAPDIEHARATALSLGLDHAVAQERLELTGYSMAARSAYRARR